MIKSIQALKDRLKVIEKGKNVEFNSVMRFYMYDRFIDRLSSSRMKDYYDVYLIYNYKFKELNKNTFRKAAEKTFNKRNFNSDLSIGYYFF